MCSLIEFFFIIAIVIAFRNPYHSSTYYAVYIVISAGFQRYLFCQVLLNNLAPNNEQMLYSHRVLRLDSLVCAQCTWVCASVCGSEGKEEEGTVKFQRSAHTREWSRDKGGFMVTNLQRKSNQHCSRSYQIGKAVYLFRNPVFLSSVSEKSH